MLRDRLGQIRSLGTISICTALGSDISPWNTHFLCVGEGPDPHWVKEAWLHWFQWSQDAFNQLKLRVIGFSSTLAISASGGAGPLT